MRKVSKIVTGLPELDRVQDSWAAVLNPALARTFEIPAVPPTVTGSRGGNAALASLITALVSLGLIKDGTSA
jgi:hypothetical protein